MKTQYVVVASNVWFVDVTVHANESYRAINFNQSTLVFFPKFERHEIDILAYFRNSSFLVGKTLNTKIILPSKLVRP